MNFFDNFPEFFDNDSRKDRGWGPITPETQTIKHEAALPKWLVYGSSVLDLGSCLGATGQWVLSHGASHYTGVEIQEKFANTSKEILSKHWSEDKFQIYQSNVKEFLRDQVSKGIKYDVVVAIGVLYVFVDIFEILELLEKITNNCIVMDYVYPAAFNPSYPSGDFVNLVHMASAYDGLAFTGLGLRLSPFAVQVMMRHLGMENKEGLIHPKRISDKSQHDVYNDYVYKPGFRGIPSPARWMARFVKTGTEKIPTLIDKVASNNLDYTKNMAENPSKDDFDVWVFDQSVADRFQQEAETHIPDYKRVIELCSETAQTLFQNKKDISIIDVGSALGYTMNHFISKGYRNVNGIENSPSMRNQSQHRDRVFLSDGFVQGEYDLILANWTLHFIRDRFEYIADMIKSLNHGGALIITDKMDHSVEFENMYYDFKRNNGVPEEVIQKKKLSLSGILTTKPLTWYLDTLKNFGMSEIQVINSRYMFNTIYARKI